MLSNELVSRGYRVQFALLADVNAADFVGLTSVPIFEDPTGARTAWNEMDRGAAKHDTFVFAPDGVRTFAWDASTKVLANWEADIRAAVEAVP